MRFLQQKTCSGGSAGTGFLFFEHEIFICARRDKIPLFFHLPCGAKKRACRKARPLFSVLEHKGKPVPPALSTQRSSVRFSAASWYAPPPAERGRHFFLFIRTASQITNIPNAAPQQSRATSFILFPRWEKICIVSSMQAAAAEQKNARRYRFAFSEKASASVAPRAANSPKCASFRIGVEFTLPEAAPPEKPKILYWIKSLIAPEASFESSEFPHIKIKISAISTAKIRFFSVIGVTVRISALPVPAASAHLIYAKLRPPAENPLRLCRVCKAFRNIARAA